MSDILRHAVELLARRDYSEEKLRQKLEQRFGEVPDEVIGYLKTKHFLNDRRYAETYVSRRRDRGPIRLQHELISRGIDPGLAAEVIGAASLPSLQDALKAKMIAWNLRTPLQKRDAARLFRALARLGYEEDAIREELTQFHEQ